MRRSAMKQGEICRIIYAIPLPVYTIKASFYFSNAVFSAAKAR